MIGRRLGHYRILSKLGEGGMGEVYLAEDTTLERKVALKLLPASLASDRRRLERFEREAKTVASLNHPNIVTLYSVESAQGVRFLAMELVEGEPLSELIPERGLPLKRLFEIAIPLADALAAAHAKGITHRDLKPGNIMVTAEGRVKVLDFGLAKLREPGVEQMATQAPTEVLTREGTILGTMPYMSPEQLEGKPADERSDIFSLGIVLYEMATGSRPFAGESSAALISAIIKDEPRPLSEFKEDLPRHLGRIIRLCLEKEPDRRLQSALDVRNELQELRRELKSGESAERPAPRAEPSGLPADSRPFAAGLRARPMSALLAVAALALLAAAAIWWSRRAATSSESEVVKQPTVAVLPFQNLTRDSTLDYLELAVPDEVTTTLSRAAGLAIRPFTMSAVYRREEFDLTAAGRELGVAHVITGQYFRELDQLHLTVEAIEIEESQLLWRERVTVAAADLLSLRQHVVERVRQGLLPRLGVPSAAAETQPTSAEAYDLYLRSLATAWDPEPNYRALEMLEQATGLDPGFAPAWAELAARLHYYGNYGGGGEEAYERSERSAREAQRLDPALLSPALRLVLLNSERGRLSEAFDAVEKLVQRRPDSAEVYFSRSYVLRYAGLLDEASRDCEVARAIDPGDRRWRSCTITFYLSGDYARAREFLALDPGSEWARDNRVALLMREGEREEALALLSGAPGEAPPYRQHLMACLEGRPAEELERLVRPVYQSSMQSNDAEQFYWWGSILASCGSRDLGLRLLREGVARGYCSMPALETDPLLEPVRAAPGFAELRRAASACRQSFERHRHAAD